MECNKVRQRLSDYIDELMPSEEKASIDSHFKSCRQCRQSLDDMRKAIEHLKNLEEVEPPQWMAQKIMAKIRSEAPAKKGILQKLFYPVHIKLPAGAVATIAIAVTAIYIFESMQPEVKVSKAPVELTEEQTIPSGRKKAGSYSKDMDFAAKKSSVLEEKKAAAVKPAQKPMPGIASGAAPKEIMHEQPMKQSPQVSAAAPKAELLVKRKKERLSWTLNVNDIESAQKECEESIIKLGGNILKKESVGNKNIVIAEIDAKKLKELREKMKKTGDFIHVKDLQTMKEEIIQIVIENGGKIIESKSDDNKKIITIEAVSESERNAKKLQSLLQNLQFIEQVKDSAPQDMEGDVEIMIVIMKSGR